MLGPAAGSSGSGTACGRPPGTGKPRAAPSPARRPAGTGKGWGQPPGGPRRDLTPGPSLFLPLEPTWGTDCRRCSIYRSRGDQERILAPRENLDAWVPRGYCQRRWRGRAVGVELERPGADGERGWAAMAGRWGPPSSPPSHCRVVSWRGGGGLSAPDTSRPLLPGETLMMIISFPDGIDSALCSKNSWFV